MRMTTIAVPALLWLVLAVSAPVHAGAQTELDHIVARVNNRIITNTDVEHARQLQLVADTASDDATRRCLEDRILVLTEIARVAPVAPAGDDELAERRSEWVARVGGSGRAAELLTAAGMSDPSLQQWFRDDVRIQSYLKRQFGAGPESDRAKAQADWIARLRQRAGLR